jgi:hypothetical protein
MEKVSVDRVKLKKFPSKSKSLYPLSYSSDSESSDSSSTASIPQTPQVERSQFKKRARIEPDDDYSFSTPNQLPIHRRFGLDYRRNNIEANIHDYHNDVDDVIDLPLVMLANRQRAAKHSRVNNERRPGPEWAQSEYDEGIQHNYYKTANAIPYANPYHPYHQGGSAPLLANVVGTNSRYSVPQANFQMANPFDMSDNDIRFASDHLSRYWSDKRKVEQYEREENFQMMKLFFRSHT